MSSSDVLPIRNLLGDPSADIPLARATIADAQNELKALSARIALLKKRVADNERIICSINRLPTEVLALVFLHAIWIHTIQTQISPGCVRATARSPWLVSQVCKRWRHVALSSHKLWSFPTIYNIEQTLPQLKLHLARSGNARLHPELAYSTLKAASFLAPLVESSDRWVTLILVLQWTADKLAPLKGNLGALEELQIESIKNGGTALAEGDRFDSFAIAPRLRKLSVKNVCGPVISLVLPWHQLTH
jgi:hypothetical protein